MSLFAAEGDGARQGTRVLRRQALLVGNGAYRSGSALANPVRDVRAVGEALRSLGWEVQVAEDLDRKGLREAVNAFAARLGPDDAAMFYYAGHGVAIEGRNYLLPVDFDAETAADAQEEAYPLDVVQEQLSARPGGVSLVVTDACRNQPFTRSWSRSVLKGFVAPPPSANETFVAFSTQAGAEALDGAAGSEHSPFAEALIDELARHGQDLDDVFRGVKTAVRAATGGEQQPWTMDNLTQGFFFDGVAETPQARLARAGTPAAQAFRGVVTGGDRSRALLVAVSDYDALADIHGESDVALMVPALESVGVAKDDLAVLTGATAEATREALARLAEASGPGDRVWVHYSGMARPARDGGALLLKDSPADGFSPGTTGTGVIPADELRRSLDLIRAAVGPAGAVTVTLDTNCTFGDVPATAAGEAPLTLVQACDAQELNFEVKGAADATVGALSWVASEAVVNRSPGASWADLGPAMSARLASAGRMAVRIEGDGAVDIETGERTSALPVDPTRSYGEHSVFLDVGRLDGLYPGAVVALSGGRTGTVVQTGLRGARVEIDPTATRSHARGVVAVALPPGTSVGADADLAGRMGPIGIPSGAATLRWAAETNYAVLLAGDEALSPPVSLAGPDAAFARWSYAAAWGKAVGDAAKKVAALEWADVPKVPDRASEASTRGLTAAATCLDGSRTTDAGVRGFRWKNGPSERRLVLLVQAADGSVARLGDRDVRLAAGQTWTSCAVLSSGETLLGVATARPWLPDTLVGLLSAPPPYDRIAASRPEEVPRGRTAAPPLTTLDDPDDAAEIDAITAP
jgi:uncharacterized caspase-like protein